MTYRSVVSDAAWLADLAAHALVRGSFVPPEPIRELREHTQALARLEARIEEAMKPFTAARELLCSIPGWSTKVAEVFIAETGADMSVFPTAAELVSWAGLSPGANESAGKIKSTKIRPGNRHLKAAVGVAALAAARSTNTTFFGARFRRITARRGPMKAVVAVEHTMVTTAWHMLVNGEFYRDPAPDHYTQRRPEHTKANAVHQLEALGYRVILEKPDAALNKNQTPNR